MLILVPLVLNAINFWLIDNILKFNPEDHHEANIVADVYNKQEEKEKRKKELGEDSPQGASNEKQEANVQNISGNFDEAFNNFVKTEITENSQQKPEVKEEETDVEKIWLPNEFDES